MRISRPSPALAVASVALVVALCGTSYAAFAIPANSVGTRQLRNNAVTSSKIAPRAINESKVAPGSLSGRSIDAGTLGKVRSATDADTATNALNLGRLAPSRYLRSNATAANAAELGGKPPAFFLPASSLRRLPATVLNNNQMATLITDGPLLIQAQCLIDKFTGSFIDEATTTIVSTSFAAFETSQTSETTLYTRAPSTWGTTSNTNAGDEAISVSLGSASADDGTNLLASITSSINAPGHFQQCVFSGMYVP